MTDIKEIESLHGRMRTVLAYLDSPVLIVNTAYKAAYVNPAFENAFSVAFADSLGKDLGHFLPPSMAEALVGAGEKVKGGAEHKHFNLQEGSHSHNIGVSPITDETNRITGIVYSFTDVTKEKQLEKVKAEFISMLLNDLHTPLNDILDVFKRLESGIKKNDRNIVLVKKGSVRAQEVMEHLENLLHITDSISGDLKLSKKEVDLASLVSSGLASLKEKARREHVRTHCFPMTFPEIFCDQDKILQVIIHIINNQITAAGAGNMLTISGAPSSENDPLHVFISIAQTGKTLQPSDFPEMFSSEEEAQPNCDPGCLAVARIVQAHGGRLFLCSVENCGSAIVLQLPV